MHTSVASPLVQRAAADEEGKGKGSGEKPRGFGFAAVAFHPFFPPSLVRLCFCGFLFYFIFLCENIVAASLILCENLG